MTSDLSLPPTFPSLESATAGADIVHSVPVVCRCSDDITVEGLREEQEDRRPMVGTEGDMIKEPVGGGKEATKKVFEETSPCKESRHDSSARTKQSLLGKYSMTVRKYKGGRPLYHQCDGGDGIIFHHNNQWKLARKTKNDNSTRTCTATTNNVETGTDTRTPSCTMHTPSETSTETGTACHSRADTGSKIDTGAGTGPFIGMDITVVATVDDTSSSIWHHPPLLYPWSSSGNGGSGSVNGRSSKGNGNIGDIGSSMYREGTSSSDGDTTLEQMYAFRIYPRDEPP